MTQLFDIGRSALTSYQNALATVSRNVANANTPGYARQSVQFGELAGGAGVSVVTLNRSADNSALHAARDAIDERAYSETRADVLSRIDTLISDDATGLAEPLRSLVDAVDGLAAQPADIASRQTLLARAEGFAAQVSGIQQNLTAEAGQASQQLMGLVGQAQTQLDELAGVQSQIDRSTVIDAATATLMDRRDVLLEGLSESLGLRGQVNTDGTLQLSLGNGQPVIEAGKAVRLGLGADEQGNLQLTTNGNLQPRRVLGGEAGGLMQSLQVDIPAAQDQLGRIALAVADTFNQAQAAGVDLNGNPGAAIFEAPEPRVRDFSSNTGSAAITAASVSDMGALPASRVTLQFASGAWSATDAGGVALPVSGSGTASDPLRFGGLSVELTGTAAAGDGFVIEPAPASRFAYVAQAPEALAAAAAGSAASSGDNSNVLALQAGLQAGVLDGGNTSIQNANVNWVSATGQSAASAITTADIARATETFALDRRDSIQGVNLDEEAADLMRYQQAYAAAAQVLATANNLFDSILAATRG